MGSLDIKLIQTREGPKFVTVLPPVEPRDDDFSLRWQPNPSDPTRFHRPGHDENFGLSGYINTRADQEG